MPAPRLLYVVTAPVTADVLLRGQLSYMRREGFDVSVACGPGPRLELVREREGVPVYPVPLEREIRPRADLRALGELVQLMRRLQPTIVNASTAKGGLLGMMAARIVGVPVRVYLVRGLRFETLTGTTRRILHATERVAAACADRIICVSPSLREIYVRDGFAPQHKTAVLGLGASNGIDPGRFVIDDAVRARAGRLRDELGIPADVPVIGFVGRPVRDKGIAELVEATEIVRRTLPGARLLIVGAGLAGDHPDEDLGALLASRGEVHLVGHVDDLAPYYAMMHVLAFPSHREGFPNVPLEAAAAGLPVVGARATGVVDAIEDGRTGRVVPIGDARALAGALLPYLEDVELRTTHGDAGRERATTSFRSEVIWERWRDEYVRLLRERGLSVPQ
jgi:glycosyltransferase involved in cell wall biosynthesis